MTENISSLLAELPKYNWISHFNHVQEVVTRSHFNKGDVSFVLDKLRENIKQKKISESQNWLLLGLIIDEHQFIVKSKKAGVFRASKYDFKSTSLLLKLIRKVTSTVSISNNTQSYFDTLQYLYTVNMEAKYL